MKKLLFFVFILFCAGCTKQKFELIIRNATIYDGSGSVAFKGDIGINADTIAFVGDLSKAESAQILDANGLALSPGFIDTHSHHNRGMNQEPSVPAAVSQGITTIIIGQDGDSFLPIKDFYKKLTDSAVAVNVGSYSGHNSIRDNVLGKDFKRPATLAEVEAMIALLKTDMEAGAFGLSTGLEYDPGIYSHKDEILALSKVLPEYNGRYISHLRSEDQYFWDALNEIIHIGEEVKIPVQISHFKLAMRGLWGKADTTLMMLNEAKKRGVNITADIYPYTYWSSTIRVLFPNRNYNDEKEAAFILKEVTTPEGIIFSRYDPNHEYDGKSLAEVAILEKKTPEKMLIELIRRLDECDTKGTDCSGSIVATSMDEEDVKKLMKWPYTNICSDGSPSGRHPRGWGAFTKVLRYYVRESNTLTLKEGIHKMTGLAAENLNISKRGLIKSGYYADLVLFDPASVKDHSTIQDPQAVSTGITNVWVNGVEVYNEKGVTKKYPGKVILRNNR